MPADVEALRRRLERERAARSEAEAIAERATRELFDRRAEQELLFAVASAANESHELEEGLSEILAAVCRLGGWQFAQVFIVDEDGTLAPHRVWHSEPGGRYRAMFDAFAGRRVAPGAGLPGMVLASGEPLLIPDVIGDPRFLRQEAAGDTALRGGLAFPARSGDQVFAVIELFSHATLDENESVLRLSETLGAQVGRLVERHRAAEQLAERSVQLEESNAELTEFAYVASHDLSEPLRTISGFVQLLQRRYEGRLDSDADEFIGFVVEGTERMQSLITDLLDYSRVSQREIVIRPVELDRLLDRVELAHGAALSESGGEIVRDPLPTVAGDEAQIERLFANLIANGLKFRGEDAPRIDVIAEREPGDARWAFTIRDNGIGIEPRHAERAFRVFQRLHSRDQYPGTGIGLSICRRVVERHGGEISIAPAATGGTELHFTLPALSEGAIMGTADLHTAKENR